MWKYRTPGIPDDMFERAEKIPITKEEIRAIQISKARLSPEDIVYDIGCGSGSVTTEAGLQAHSGRIFAVDVNPQAVELTKRNLEKFTVRNVEVITGDALGVIGSLPKADSIFIGGTGNKTADIIRVCEGQLRSGGRIIIGVIQIETLAAVIDTLKGLKFESVDITQITVAKSRKTSTGTMMLARNPVTVISATRM